MNTLVPQPPLDEVREKVEPSRSYALDRTDPRCIINLLPQSVVKHIQNIPQDLLEMNEDELYADIWMESEVSHSFVQRLRLSFWREYDRAQGTNARMVLGNICVGLCSPDHFLAKVCRDKRKLAWVLLPPVDYDIALEELLHLGLEQMREILVADLQLPGAPAGTIDAKLADVKFRIWQAVEMRKKGSIIQRVHQESLNVNYNKNVGSKILPPSSMDEIERKLEDLRRQTQLALGAAVDPVPVITMGNAGILEKVVLPQSPEVTEVNPGDPPSNGHVERSRPPGNSSS